MRAIFGILLILVGAAMWACEFGGRSAPAAPVAKASSPAWVRTADGWERPDTWSLASNCSPQPAPLRLHPLVVAAGQLLASLFALVAFSPSKFAANSTAFDAGSSRLGG